jgi:outer membrane protein assembly factor BamB
LLWSDVTADFLGAWLDASIDATGDVFTCGDEHGRRHTANGVSIWTASWPGEECYGITAMGDGGAIAVGAADGDAWLRRLDEEGDLVWHETYDGPSGSSDVAVDVVFDGDNIAVVGRRGEGGSNRAIWIAKYDPDGEQLWEQAVMGSGPENGGEGVAIDASDNIFASGYLEAPGGVNLWLRKLTP